MEEDLFNTPEILPQEVRDIIERYEEMDNSYTMCRNLIEELEPHGYTCDYGLDGIPYELKKIKTMNNTKLKVIEQPYFDRYLFLTYHEEEIVGLNFWQGIDQRSYESVMNDKGYEPNIHLTDIYNRLKISYETISDEERINRAIDFYIDAFIIQGRNKETTLIPKGQTDIIKEALNYYYEQFKKFNSVPTDTENYKMFDLMTLEALMNYPIKVEINQTDKNKFSSNYGIDFPIYN